MQRTNSVKYLSVKINQHLEWNKHIGIIKNEITKTIYKLKQLTSVLNVDKSKIIYYFLVEIIINYGFFTWCGAYDNQLDRLKITQKWIC